MNERIKKVRKALDLTQRNFGARIGTTQNAIANYETGHRNPSSAVIDNICKTFNVSENWLRTGEGEMFIQQSRDEELAAFMNELLSEESTDFRRRLVAALSRLRPEQWDALESVALGLMQDTVAPAITPVHTPTVEEEARAEAEEYYRQILAEKERAAKSQVLPNDTDSNTLTMA